MLAGTGAALGYSTWSRYEDLATTCGGTSPGCTDKSRDSVEHHALATNVLLGAAAAATATSLVLFLLEDGPSERAIGITPTGRGAIISIHY